jgi:hypothetical protein
MLSTVHYLPDYLVPPIHLTPLNLASLSHIRSPPFTCQLGSRLSFGKVSDRHAARVQLVELLVDPGIALGVSISMEPDHTTHLGKHEVA